MRAFTLTIKILAIVFVLVGSLHLFLGLHADDVLGAKAPADAIANPTLDSQNRFYGITFTLMGVVLYLCAGDLRRYAAMLDAVLAVLFVAGLARVVSWIVYGAPAPAIIAIGAIDLFAPPILYFWFKRLPVAGPALPAA